MSATFLASLDAALRADDPPALRALLDAGPLPVLSSPLVAQATSKKASRCVALLLELGHPAAATRVDGICALHLVRDPKTARLLLAAGVPVDAPSPSSGTPLHMAAANGGAPVIKVLLDAGADPDALQSTDNRTPLALACLYGRTVAVKALLARPPATETCFNLLAEYAQRGLEKKAVAVLSALLEHLPADLEPSPGYDHALHIAASAGSPEGVECLLKAGAMVDRPDREGRTPAFLALRSATASRRPRSIEAFRLLVAAGADLDRPCGETTPRALAAKYGVEL